MQNIIKPIFGRLAEKFYNRSNKRRTTSNNTSIFFKGQNLGQTAYTYTRDAMPPISKSIKPNQEIDLEAFENSSELIFHTPWA